MTDTAVAPTGTAPVEGLFSPRLRARSAGFAGTMLLVGFAALALVTTMPVAVRDLDGLGQYALAYGGFVTTGLFGGLVAGRAADRLGPYPPLLAGLGLSVLALLLCGTAGSIWLLVAGRGLDGFAAGLVAVGVNVAVGRSYPAGLRPRALSLMSTCWVLPSLAGPPVAGIVTEAFSWRWVFLGLAALTALPALLLPLLARAGTAAGPAPGPTPESGPGPQGAEAPTGTPPAGPEEPDGPSNLGSAALLALGAGLLQYAVGGRSLPHLAAAVTGALLLARYVPRLLPPGTLRARGGLPAAVLLGGVCSGLYFTLETFTPLMLLEQRGLPVSLSGLAFTGATLAWAGAAWLQGHRWAAVPRHRLVLGGVALLAGAAALGGLGTLTALPWAVAASALVAAGLAMGLIVPSLTVLVLDHCPPDQQGRYTSALQLTQGLGQVLVLGAASLLFNSLPSNGPSDPSRYAAVFGAILLISLPALLPARRTGHLIPSGDPR